MRGNNSGREIPERKSRSFTGHARAIRAASRRTFCYVTQTVYVQFFVSPYI